MTEVVVSFKSLEEMPRGQQQLDEYIWMMQHVAGLSSFLEIGSCEGRSLVMMSRVMQSGGRIRSIDIEQHPEFIRNVGKLRDQGFDVDFYIGDSKSPEAIEWAKAQAPYDLVFIDGDHSYEGVREDFLNYRDFGQVVGFHDVNNQELGVRQLWREIKDVEGYVAQEIAVTGYYMGIGILERCTLIRFKRGNEKYA